MSRVTFGGWRRWFTVGAILAAVAIGVAATQLPGIGAGGLLHPARRPVSALPPPACENATFAGEGVRLEGWRCRAAGPRRGTLVYLHGIADNRESGAGAIERFTRRGFDVLAYDSRAHGGSTGEACTYGFFEKDDLRSVLDTIEAGPIVLLGTSLGGAVALQHASRDTRVSAVVAAEVFSDLRTVAIDRAPFVFTPSLIERAFRLAEQQGHFEVDAVSPVRAAANVVVPVLLIHGDADDETPPDHSRRVFDALRGPKELILVPGARHNQSLRGDVWERIERWVERQVGSGPA